MSVYPTFPITRPSAPEGYPSAPPSYDEALQGCRRYTSNAPARPQLYQCVRIALLVMLGLQLLGIPIAITGSLPSLQEEAAKMAEDEVTLMYFVFWITMAFIAGLTLLGMVGVFGEHYCMTKGFAVTLTVVNLLLVFAVMQMDAEGIFVYIYSWLAAIMAYYVASQSLKYNQPITIVYA
ncbi:hypothetical protein HDE_07738 [Halotydeus destructor]|nr:hypothetical protein HDE_07738 [Halotydeus destructor]